MDASERLAALLAGELDADERDALEAELERDPELRATLAAMRRADEQLRFQRSPTPSEGFEQRLDDVVAEALRDVLGETTAAPRRGSSPTVVPAETLAARRRSRATRRVQALAGVAAAAVLLVGGGVFLSQIGSGDAEDSMMSTMDDSGDAGMEQEAADEAVSDDAAVAGPVVVADDRDLTDAELDALLTDGQLDVVRAGALDRDRGRDVASAFQAALGAGPADGDVASEGEADAGVEEAPEAEAPETESDADEADGTEDTDDAAELESLERVPPQLITRDGTPLEPQAASDVGRCLDELLAAEPGAIPAYAELATYDDREVVVFGLVTVDPRTDAFTRNEVWVLDRGTCDVLRFSQD